MEVDSEDNTTRMSSIMQVDTPALLKTLKELEAQLSQYQRQDVPPKWAQSLMPRLELVEKSMKTIMVPQHSAPSEGVSLKDLEQEEVFVDKIKKIVDERTEAMKLMFDSKISSSSLELDRLHKLLYIRPTTSELQQVMMHVRDVDSKVLKVHGDVVGSIQSTVQEKLTDEMESIMERLRAAEEHSDKAVELVLNKVGDVEGDVRRVREGTKGEFGELVDTIKKLHEEDASMKTVMSELESNLKEMDGRCQSSLEGMSKKLEEIAALCNDTESTANERMDGIDDTIAAIEENQRDEACKTEERIDEVQYSITSMGEKLDELRNALSAQIDGIKSNQESLSEMLEKTNERQQAIMDYMNKLEKFHPIEKISDNMEAIEYLKESSQSVSQATNVLKQDMKDMQENQIRIQESLDEVPNQIEVQSLKIDAANNEITQLKEGHKNTKSELSKHTTQLDDLSVLKVDMIMVKGVSESQDDRMKKMIRQVVEMNENFESQEKRLDDVIVTQEVKNENTMSFVESVKSEFEQKMENQAAEMEAKIEVLKDTVVNSGGGSTMQGSSKVAGSRAMRSTLRSSTGKIADDGNAQRIIEMIEEEDSHKQETVEDSVMNETSDKIDYLMQLCLNFEEIASFRNAVPRDVPNSICYDIAACSQSVAQVVSETADLQAIQKMVRGAPQDIVYEDTVTQNRKTYLENILQDLRDKLKQHHPDAGLLRLEARDMFMSRLHHALQIALSKYDQVLTTGHTRLGRVAVPTCIACDRPLLTKAPRQHRGGSDAASNSSNGENGLAGGSTQYLHKSPLAPIGHVNNPNQSFYEPTQSTFGTQIGSLDDELEALGQSSAAESRQSRHGPPRSAGGNQERHVEHDVEAQSRGKEYGQYVKRGGFKMPPKLPQLSSTGPPKH